MHPQACHTQALQVAHCSANRQFITGNRKAPSAVHASPAGAHDMSIWPGRRTLHCDRGATQHTLAAKSAGMCCKTTTMVSDSQQSVPPAVKNDSAPLPASYA